MGTTTNDNNNNSNSTSKSDANDNKNNNTRVVLNVYDLTPLNNYLYWLGFGIFHSGIEGSLFISFFHHHLFFFFLFFHSPFLNINCFSLSISHSITLIISLSHERMFFCYYYYYKNCCIIKYNFVVIWSLNFHQLAKRYLHKIKKNTYNSEKKILNTMLFFPQNRIVTLFALLSFILSIIGGRRNVDPFNAG